jgi:hypothetical protein
LQKSRKLNLDVKNIFAGSHIEHSWRCSYPKCLPGRYSEEAGPIGSLITRASTSVCTRVLPLAGTTFTGGPHQNKAIIQDPKSTFSQLVEHFILGNTKNYSFQLLPSK